jgi:antitoxin component YwqK of YwqJK toxin-antitoxin module
MKHYLLLLFNLIFVSSIFSQNDAPTKFYYKDGSLSSVGYLRNGKPDGYWKTYYQNGSLKSEGNRKYFQLDSLWIFYEKSGEIKKVISYKEGLRNGDEIQYKQGVKYESIPYKKNIKEGKTYRYFPDGKISFEAVYVNNELFGKGYEFDTIGNIITIETYKNGILSRTQHINRTDSKMDKHGLWVTFDDDKRIVSQGTWKHGLKHGYFKTYDKKGNLLKTTKYINGEIQEDAIETAKLEVKRSYYPDKKLKTYKSFRNGIPDGVHKEFDKNGNAISTVIYKLGIVVAKGGTVDDKGQKQGLWTEYFVTGEKKSEGLFVDGKKSKKWNYYYISGKIEQVGNYRNGKAVDNWVWYYENGNIRREQTFINGKADGLFVEYDINGNEIAKGEFYSGKKDGDWFYVNDIYKLTGRYEEGVRTGVWKQTNTSTNRVVSETNYFEDIKDGVYKLFYDTGVLKVLGKYESGLKQGYWKYYNEQGVNTLTVKYSDGVDVKYNDTDAVKVD